jgi:hypothetical protein
MRIFGISLYVIIALFFAVHAVRTQQNIYWLLILFLFPGLGSLVYFFVIYLPALRQSRGARAATRAISQLVDPNRAVREARTNFDRAPTVEHRMRLGAALLNAGNAAEALEHYRAAASGPFSSDPALLQGLAGALFANSDFSATQDTLEKLFAVHPPPASSPSLSCCMHGPWPRLTHQAHVPRSRRRSPAQATLHPVACTLIGQRCGPTMLTAVARANFTLRSCTMRSIGHATPANITASGCNGPSPP